MSSPKCGVNLDYLAQTITFLSDNIHQQQQEFSRQPDRVTVEAAVHTARTLIHFPAVSPSSPISDPAPAFFFTSHQRSLSCLPLHLPSAIASAFFFTFHQRSCPYDEGCRAVRWRPKTPDFRFQGEFLRRICACVRNSRK